MSVTLFLTKELLYDALSEGRIFIMAMVAAVSVTRVIFVTLPFKP